MSRYLCYKCETTHTTENMVSSCASCYAALDTTNRLLTKELQKAREYLRECDQQIKSLSDQRNESQAQVQALTRENAELREALSGRTVSCGNCSAIEARERDTVKDSEQCVKDAREWAEIAAQKESALIGRESKIAELVKELEAFRRIAQNDRERRAALEK